ncbi:MAG: PKD domain-containing protein [Chloroflexota bacterium]|nr:PKD domain-containing protein [Chloroflexota bacterium]
MEADFAATPLSGTNPLTVTFMNGSTGSYDAARWDFGDGFTSTVQDPSHTYAAAGTFTVTLTVSGTGGVDTITRPAYISVALFGDLDGDCDVDIDDIMLVAGQWNTESGDLDYDDSYDIDSDGDIDVKDVMLIAAEWGNTCSGAAMTCPRTVRDVSQAGADVTFVPSVVTRQEGESFTMSVAVAEVANLGGFEFDLVFDPEAITVTDVRLGDFLASSGNNVVALGPRDGGSGRPIFGGFSYGEGEGAFGLGTLATLDLMLVSETETILRLEDVQLVASDANRITVGSVGEGHVRIGAFIYLPVVLRSH